MVWRAIQTVVASARRGSAKHRKVQISEYNGFYSVLDKLKSLGIPNITEDASEELILAHLRSACIKFKACKQSLADRDNILAQFNIDLSDEEIEILSNFVLIDYLSATYINVPSLLRKNLSSKDFHVFSDANHLNSLIALRDAYKTEVRQMVSIYSNQGSDLFSSLVNSAASTT
jgi:hypothetical protein